MRISEVVAPKWSDIDFKRVSKINIGNSVENKTAIIEQGAKTKSSKRTIPVPLNIMEELKKHKKMLSRNRESIDIWQG